MANTIVLTDCSGNQGREAALYFLHKGWSVVAGNLDMKLCLVEPALTLNLVSTSIDVSCSHSIKALIELATTKFGSINAFVFNHDFMTFGMLEEASDEEVQKQLNGTLLGVVNCSRCIVEHMREEKQGVIVNLVSSAGLVGTHMFGLYGAMHASIKVLTEALASDLYKFGVQVKLAVKGEFLYTSLANMHKLEGRKQQGLTSMHYRFGKYHGTRHNRHKDPFKDNESHQYFARLLFKIVTEPTPFVNSLDYESSKLLKLSSMSPDDALQKVYIKSTTPNGTVEQNLLWTK